MPFDIFLDEIPAGVSAEAKKGPGEVEIYMMEFTSTEDGQVFIQRVEGWLEKIIRKADPGNNIQRSRIDHVLVIINQDGRARIYINELKVIKKVRILKPAKTGDFVYKDDIQEIDSLRFLDIDIPNDVGVIILISAGWRKGLFYDYGPLCLDPGSERSYDLYKTLGQCYSHLEFQEKFSITEHEWEILLNNKWFLFSALKGDTIHQILNYVRNNWDIDDLLQIIQEELLITIDKFLVNWQNHPIFKKHFDIIDRAVERYKSGDYISCTSIVFPRIEGLLRDYLQKTSTSIKVTQKNLSLCAVSSRTDNDKSLLLPHRFEYYLEKIYFADFDPNDQLIEFSRNSIGHGVARKEQFNKKAATIGLLVIQQLYLFFYPIK